MIFALLALTAMSLAAVALVRSVDTAGLIVGNLGFRKDGVQYASRAAERAISWLGQTLTGNSTLLNGDNPGLGYYATVISSLDPTGRSTAPNRTVVDWADRDCADYPTGSYTACVAPVTLSQDVNSRNRSAYLIMRLCTAALPPTDPGNSCARGLSASTSEGGKRANSATTASAAR